jgi:hypothetical protein
LLETQVEAVQGGRVMLSNLPMYVCIPRPSHLRSPSDDHLLYVLLAPHSLFCTNATKIMSYRLLSVQIHHGRAANVSTPEKLDAASVGKPGKASRQMRVTFRVLAGFNIYISASASIRLTIFLSKFLEQSTVCLTSLFWSSESGAQHRTPQPQTSRTGR